MIYFILIYKWHLLPSLKDTKSIFLVKSMKTHLIIKLNYLNHLRIQFYLKTRIRKIQSRNKVIKDRYKCVTDWICKAPSSPRCAYQVRYTRLYQMEWHYGCSSILHASLCMGRTKRLIRLVGTITTKFGGFKPPCIWSEFTGGQRDVSFWLCDWHVRTQVDLAKYFHILEFILDMF